MDEFRGHRDSEIFRTTENEMSLCVFSALSGDGVGVRRCDAACAKQTLQRFGDCNVSVLHQLLDAANECRVILLFAPIQQLFRVSARPEAEAVPRFNGSLPDHLGDGLGG